MGLGEILGGRGLDTDFGVAVFEALAHPWCGGWWHTRRTGSGRAIAIGIPGLMVRWRLSLRGSLLGGWRLPRDCWWSEHPANPHLRIEIWGTRCGGGWKLDVGHPPPAPGIAPTNVPRASSPTVVAAPVNICRQLFCDGCPGLFGASINIDLPPPLVYYGAADRACRPSPEGLL